MRGFMEVKENMYEDVIELVRLLKHQKNTKKRMKTNIKDSVEVKEDIIIDL